MKAKDYAQRIIDSEYSQESINAVFHDMAKEISTIATSRRTQSNRALRAIIMEQNQKWTAICRIVNDKQNVLSEDGWLKLLKIALPETELILKQ
jgi:hypothetical protein